MQACCCQTGIAAVTISLLSALRVNEDEMSANVHAFIFILAIYSQMDLEKERFIILYGDGVRPSLLKVVKICEWFCVERFAVSFGKHKRFSIAIHFHIVFVRDLPCMFQTLRAVRNEHQQEDFVFWQRQFWFWCRLWASSGAQHYLPCLFYLTFSKDFALFEAEKCKSMVSHFWHKGVDQLESGNFDYFTLYTHLFPNQGSVWLKQLFMKDDNASH